MADYSAVNDSSTSLRLVLSRESDLPTLVRLSNDTVDSTLTLEQLKGYLKAEKLLSIWHQDRVVGFIAYRAVIDEAELDQIVIDSHYHGQGLGFLAMLAWHRRLVKCGIGIVFLDVRATNTPALALYQKLGYQQVGIRKGYYQHDGQLIDANLMQCPLVVLPTS